MSDERLRTAYAAALAARASGDRVACPTPDALRSIVTREGDEAARLAQLDHVMGCPDCRREFELLRAVEAAAREPRRVAWRPFALAAGVLLAVGLAVTARRPSPDTAIRGGGGAVRIVAPVGDVPAERAALLVWHAVPGSSRYDVEVTTPEGDVRLSTSTADTAITLPSPRPGEHLRWWVTAHVADGELVSDVVRVSISP